jgi:hypothetical protein
MEQASWDIRLAQFVLRQFREAFQQNDLAPLTPGREIGEIRRTEDRYPTSLDEIFGGDRFHPEPDAEKRARDWWDQHGEKRLKDWWRDRLLPGGNQVRASEQNARQWEPEPNCAWYCPVHFFGEQWGIYIREDCILQVAERIVEHTQDRSFVDPGTPLQLLQLLRASLYLLYLHEAFHHKVESFGFRLLVTTGEDHYWRYKENVYKPTFLTNDCLEESLANAESYRRIGEPPYTQHFGPAITKILPGFLKHSFTRQPAGYAQAVGYLTDEQFYTGVFELQTQVLEGKLNRVPPGRHPNEVWQIVADTMVPSMAVDGQIFLVSPEGAGRMFPEAPRSAS